MAAVTLRGAADGAGDPVLRELCGAGDGGGNAEKGRLAFARLWNAYNFRVKTFQESVVAGWQSAELRVETVSAF
jgi:hypothetical protein